MVIITFLEIVYLLLTTLLVGYIFTGYIPYYKNIPKNEDDLVTKYTKKTSSWEEIKFTMLVAAPGIILHELGHKFLGLLFGLNAEYQIYWFGMGLALILKILSSPFLLLAPGYVALSGTASRLDYVLVAFAGPFVNLLLYLTAFIVLKTKRKMHQKEMFAWLLLKQINIILFLFNLIPIPGFDGFHIFSGLYEIFIKG